MISGSGMDIDVGGRVDHMALRSQIHRGYRGILIAGPDVQCLVGTGMIHGVEFIGPVADSGRSDLPNSFNFPCSIFQRSVRQRAAIIIEINDLRISRFIQFQGNKYLFISLFMNIIRHYYFMLCLMLVFLPTL